MSSLRPLVARCLSSSLSSCLSIRLNRLNRLNGLFIHVHHKPSALPTHLFIPLFSTNADLALHKCWKCEHPLSDDLLFCSRCDAIQCLQNESNYFKVFGLRPTFTIDVSRLTTQFKAMQMRSHPDKFANKSQKEHEYSMENSSIINRAYKSLSDPYERGQHLLQLLYNNSIEETNTDIEMDKQFLMEMMELNEDIASDDSSYEHLSDIKTLLETNSKNIQNDIRIAFDSCDSIKAKQSLVKLKFYNSAILKLKEKLQYY